MNTFFAPEDLAAKLGKKKNLYDILTFDCKEPLIDYL